MKDYESVKAMIHKMVESADVLSVGSHLVNINDEIKYSEVTIELKIPYTIYHGQVDMQAVLKPHE